MLSFNHLFSEYNEAIGQVLDTFFERSIQQAHTIHPRYELLWQELARVTQNGGKRFRPKMTLMSYRAFGGSDIASAIPIAAAMELLHSSLLIHDDIIDRELVRRGELNVSGAYMKNYYRAIRDTTQRRHYSDGAALLGGDLLLTSIWAMIDQPTLSPQKNIAVKAALSRIIFEVAAGQLLDSETALKSTDLSAELIARYKTASYSFVGPLEIGALLASATPSSIPTLRTFAEYVGIAYQLHDDILGVFGDEATTGKSTSSDLREGKQTYLVEQFLATASTTDREAFTARFGDPLVSDADVHELMTLLEKSDAKAKVQSRIDYYLKLATQSLDQLPLDRTSHHDFELLMQAAVRRVT